MGYLWDEEKTKEVRKAWDKELWKKRVKIVSRWLTPRAGFAPGTWAGRTGMDSSLSPAG